MDAALLIARLLLAAVFTLAGVAKLSDLKGSRKAIIEFGLPALLASPLGLLLPLAELAVGAALIPASSAWWGALGALALLLLFVVGISINLARGKKPDCHCFGQLHSAPAGWKTLARNGVLAAVAGFVLWEGYEGGAGPSAIAWLGALSAAQLLGLLGGVLVLALLAGQWWFLVHLLRQNGRLLVRLETLEESACRGRQRSAIAERHPHRPRGGASGRLYGPGVRPFGPPRRDPHPRSVARLRQAGAAALYGPWLRPLQRDAAGGGPLARGARPEAHPRARQPGRGGGEQDQGLKSTA